MPIYQALLPGGLEHRLLMGMPREPTIYAEVNKVCPLPGRERHSRRRRRGCTRWYRSSSRRPEDGRQAIEAAFRGHGSLKHVVGGG